MRPRLDFLDGLRGVAVAAMIVFHVLYDMRMLGWRITWVSVSIWQSWPKVVTFLFLFCSGVSLHLVHAGRIRWAKLAKRLVKLGGAAGMVSIATYGTFPRQFVFFGVLHCLLVASVLGAITVNRRWIAWVLTLLIVGGEYLTRFDLKWVWATVGRSSLDFVPVYPWLWAVLVGVLAAPYLSRTGFLRRMYIPKSLRVFGMHSLVIYLVHQPLVFGLLWLIKQTV